MASEAAEATNRLEIGLDNLGNTCFANSSLQCLIHIGPLIKYFLETDLTQSVNRDSPTKGKIATSFGQLVKEVYGAPGSSSISPGKFLREVRKHAPHLMDNQQQDCQEFLRFLLDKMSEDLCRNGKHDTSPLSHSNSVSSTASVTENNLQSSFIKPTVAAETTFPGIRPITRNRSRHQTQLTHDNSISSSVSSSSHALDTETTFIALPDNTADSPKEVDSYETTIAPLISASVRTKQMKRVGSRKFKPLASPLNNETINEKSEMDDMLASFVSLPPISQKHLNISNTTAALPSVSMIPSPVSSPKHVAQPPSSESPHDDPTTLSASNSTSSADKFLREKADSSWEEYLKLNDSVITDLFSGQLQSTIECLTCHHKSFTFDPFLDLSVPIPKTTKPKPKSSSVFARKGNNNQSNNNLANDYARCTLEECIEKLLVEELLDGDNMVTCDRCNMKRCCSKKLSIYRFPYILVIHIKRFRYLSDYSRDKLQTDVNFPMTDLDITHYLSPECLNTSHSIKYDLIGVSNHFGGLSGGHYIAHIDTNSKFHPIHRQSDGASISNETTVNGDSNNGNEARWMCFNDNHVTKAQPNLIAGPSAYVLFYKLRQTSQV